MRRTLIGIIALTLACCLPMDGTAKRHSSRDALADSVMRRVFGYAQQVDTVGRGSHSTYAYTKVQMRTNKRNASLALVPTMYAISHGVGRRFISEYYSQVDVDKEGRPSFRRLLNLSTIPHRHSTMTPVLSYMTPNIYGETLFQENILSPFHRSNRRYYKYSVTPLPFGMAQVYVYPRIKNTQLVTARAILNMETGQIRLVDFEGEYDMTRFYISIVMGKEGFMTLGPAKCDMRANFRFMGNKISGRYSTYYNLPQTLGDTLDNAADTALMAKVRPEQLSADEEMIYRDYYHRLELRRLKASEDSTGKNFLLSKNLWWDIVGDNLLNRISSGFGKDNQGYFRIDPLFNPLYMGYSHNKGVVYKFKLRGQYKFDDNFRISLGMRGGYSFRQHRFYIRVPLRLDYNAKHEGYLEVESGNGNRININRVARRALGYIEAKDSLGLFSPGEMPVNPLADAQLTEFKDNYLRFTNHWRFTPKWALELGVVAHDRLAVKPEFYEKLNYPTRYTSVAPAIGLEWRPLAERGPVLSLNYEQGIKRLFGGNIEYGRVEFDTQSIIYASRRRMFSMRLGTGFYTRKGEHWDFVDYTNFHDNNIPGGWNDSWTGDFELLSSQWYNASDYYLRANFTYEAPMILSAWLPLVGRFIEKERFYVSGLSVKHLSPYSEWGYGVSTRVMSLAAFAAFRHASFDGVGFRFGFELFRNW